MLEAIGQFGLHYKGQTQGSFGEFSGYAILTKQSHRVPGTRHRDIVYQGLSTVGYR